VLRTLLVALIAAALIGCSDEPAAIAGEGSFPEVDGARDEAPAAYEPAARRIDWTREVELVPVTWDQWNREREAFVGNIVVVDYWATWCAPCRERFPRMVEMSREYGPRGVVFVSLSLDDRDDPLTTPDVTEFLRAHDSRMPNYLMDEIIPDAFDRLDLLGIPAVDVFDAAGARRYRLTGDDPRNQFTDDDVERAVLELLTEQSS
jgi:thiol-disulfide isomerase/thioredoxin